MTQLYKLFFAFVCCIAACISAIAPAAAALPIAIDGEPLPSLAPMLEDVQPAVVNISTRTTIRVQENPLMQDPFFRRFFNLPGEQQRRSSSLGSGVIVDAKNGYVVTNHHVIENADEITVTTKDGTELEATLVGSDTASDVAVIKVEARGLVEIVLGQSEALRVGDFVVAIGSPFGLSQTVTSGIVSALGRSGLGIEGYEDFIQTDASINPGNSGGALVNLRGELIGINTAILSRGGGSVGIGLSIPVDMVKSLMAQIIDHGEVKRGLLGVVMQDLTPGLAKSFGVPVQKGALVSEVIPGSGAEKSGLRDGDVIVRFNGIVVESGSDLRNAVGLLRAGSEATVEYYRNGRLNKVKATIVAPDDGSIKGFAGARFANVEPTSNFRGGIEVVEIQPRSEAAFTGLEQGDVIVSVNNRRVTSIAQMKRSINKVDDVLLIKLIRNGRSLVLVIQ